MRINKVVLGDKNRMERICVCVCLCRCDYSGLEMGEGLPDAVTSET